MCADITMDAIWQGFEAFIDLGRTPSQSLHWGSAPKVSIGQDNPCNSFQLASRRVICPGERYTLYTQTGHHGRLYIYVSAYRQPMAGCSHSYFQQCGTKFSK